MKKMICLLLGMLMLYTIFPAMTASAIYDWATDYTFGTTEKGYSYNQKECNVYKIHLSTPAKLNLHLTSELGYLFFAIMDDTGTRVEYESIYEDETTKKLDHRNNYYLCAGDYYFYFMPGYLDCVGSYEFTIAATPIYETFPEAMHGSDNTQQTANPITYNTNYVGCITNTDRLDYYQLQMNQSGRVRLHYDADFLHVFANLYDENENLIWSETISGNIETLEPPSYQTDLYLVQGIYYFRIVSAAHHGEYQFRMEFTDSMEFHEESVSVTNNSIQSASSILMNYPYQGFLALNDKTDTYSIGVNLKNPIFHVESELPELMAKLSDKNGTTLWEKQITANADSQTINFTESIPVEEGNYFLTVSHENYMGNYSFYLSNGGRIRKHQNLKDMAPGSIINEVLHTDIRAFIDGHPIRSYNIDGYTAIVAEDLANYGFQVVYNDEKRALYIDDDSKAVTSTYQHSENTQVVGTKAMDVYLTDIKTYSYGYPVDGYNVNGYTIVFLEDLNAFGTCQWDGTNKTISFNRH